MTELYLVYFGLPLSDCVFKALVSNFYSCSKNTETTILSVDAEKCLTELTGNFYLQLYTHLVLETLS